MQEGILWTIFLKKWKTLFLEIDIDFRINTEFDSFEHSKYISSNTGQFADKNYVNTLAFTIIQTVLQYRTLILAFCSADIFFKSP